MATTLTQYLYQGGLAMLVFCGPILGAAAAVGLIVGLLQAVTQIQDQTLPQIAKMTTVALLLMMFGFWLSSPIVEFTRDLFTNFHRLTR
jgi:type III secretion protein S